MKKSKKPNVRLPEQLAKQKAIKIRVPAPQRSTVRLDDMNEAELRRELDSLPTQIVRAREARDRLWSHLRERWSTAYSNDQDFITAYARAEAAGQEVVYLLERTVKAGRIWYERYSGKLL